MLFLYKQIEIFIEILIIKVIKCYVIIIYLKI